MNEKSAPAHQAGPSPESAASETDPEAEIRARAIIEKAFEAAIAAFYEKVRTDDVIGPVFRAVVHDWDAHKQTMVDFWSRATLGTQRYNGMPFPPHARLRLEAAHFERWLTLWQAACVQTMPPPLAQHVGRLSANMSQHWSQALEALEAQAQALEGGETRTPKNP